MGTRIYVAPSIEDVVVHVAVDADYIYYTA